MLCDLLLRQQDACEKVGEGLEILVYILFVPAVVDSTVLGAELNFLSSSKGV